MRYDQHLDSLNLQRHQKFFLEVWHNMTLDTSLDSNRVMCMNSRNIVNELLTLLSKKLQSIDDDIDRIRKETILILSSDELLKMDNWKSDTTEFIELLHKSEGNKALAAVTLVQYYGRDFRNRLYKSYLSDLRSEILQILSGVDGNTAEFDHRLYNLTGNFLSCLIDAGYSIEALYTIYRRVFVPIEVKSNYNFLKKLDLSNKLLSDEDIAFEVFLRLEGVKRGEALPKSIGNVSFYFKEETPINSENDNPGIKKFFSITQNRAFAVLKVNAKDIRSAGAIAHENISSLIDLIRFEFESSIIKVDDTFVAKEIHGTKPPRIAKIPSVVPNPNRNIDEATLGEFIASVGTILISDNLDEESRDRIKSTFRLYRSGLDSTSFEQKLLNWWTAIEYLIRGNGNSGKIGEAVEKQLSAILCLDFLSKHIENTRRTLTSIKENQKKDDDTFPIFKEKTLTEIFDILKDDAERTKLISQISFSPFISFKIERFGKSLSKTQSILSLIEDHERRVKWHIQRIYRARCDIVHSAERIHNSSLLCANLEFYLKTLLANLLDEFSKKIYLTGPKEFLDRSQYLFQQMTDSLKANDETIIKCNLHTGVW